MEKLVKPARVVFIALVLAVLIGIYGSTLYDLQIRRGEQYLAASNSSSVVTTSTVAASRGSILDRNGNLLVSSETVYSIDISRSVLLKQQSPNDIILSLINAAVTYGVEYTDTLPITMSGSYEYLTELTSTEQSRTRLQKYLEAVGVDPDISASDLIVWFKNRYNIDYTTKLADARRIIGVRYELELRVYVNVNPYVFAQDVDVGFIAVVSEMNLPAVSVSTSTQRVYHTDYAAHVLGYTGSMSAEAYEETYKALGYPMDAVVGRSGIEQAFEEYLHGTDGKIVTVQNEDGTVTDQYTSVQAQAGSNVYLSLDIGMQEVAENALADTIAQMNAERIENNQETAEGGAVVVLDVSSSETLAMASYPTYNLSTYYENAGALNTDETRPLINRATSGQYNPGSTFKMVTSLAGLREGYITRWTAVLDKGIYTVYDGFHPRCWIYPNTHGTVDVVGALQHSCNYFFYWLGDKLTAYEIADTAADFGLGSKTGIEIYEISGILATPEYKKEFQNDNWYPADTLLVSIGQGNNEFTPVQLANYVATIANGGTLHRVTLLSQVRSYDYTSVVKDQQPDVMNVIDDENGYIEILQEGMKAVTSEGGTAASVFKGYQVKVAAKTGTVQSSTADMNTGVFVCYAPANDPEIAIAVVVEKGGSGAALMNVAKEILDYYFGEDSENIELSDWTLMQ